MSSSFLFDDVLIVLTLWIVSPYVAYCTIDMEMSYLFNKQDGKKSKKGKQKSGVA